MLGDPPAIRLTQDDLGRLDALLAGLPTSSASLEFLRREVDRATVVEDAEAAAVREARLLRLFRRRDGQARHRHRSAFRATSPGQPHPISILTPVGAALLGLAEGQSIAYETLDGRTKTLTVVRLLPS